jgi:hypothetical protein
VRVPLHTDDEMSGLGILPLLAAAAPLLSKMGSGGRSRPAPPPPPPPTPVAGYLLAGLGGFFVGVLGAMAMKGRR